MQSAISHWLLVERLENWNVDRSEQFRQFGLPRGKKKLGDLIKTGDLLIFYVSSGISSFADVREARADGLLKLGLEGDYDSPYPWRVMTKPVLTLPRDRWVPIKSLIADLSLTAGRPDWRQCMRTSLRRLERGDATVILESMRFASK
jgi:hypothetical protein